MASSMSKSLRSLLECPVCMEEMVVPKALPCIHTVCLGCLKGMMQIGTHQLNCPICRQKVTLGPQGVDGLPSNPTIMHMKDHLKSQDITKKSETNVNVAISTKVGEFAVALGTLCNMDAQIRQNAEEVSNEIDLMVEKQIKEAQQNGETMKRKVQDVTNTQISSVTDGIKQIQEAIDMFSKCRTDPAKFKAEDLYRLEKHIPSSFENTIMSLSEEGKLEVHQTPLELFKYTFPQTPKELQKEFTMNGITSAGFTFLHSGHFIVGQDSQITKFNSKGEVVAVSAAPIGNVKEITYHELRKQILVTNLSENIYVLEPSMLDLVKTITLPIENFNGWDICNFGDKFGVKNFQTKTIAIINKEDMLVSQIVPPKRIGDWRMTEDGYIFGTCKGEGMIRYNTNEDAPCAELILNDPSCSSLDIDTNGNIWVSLKDKNQVSVYQASVGFPRITNIPYMSPGDIHCAKNGRVAISTRDPEGKSVTVFTVK